MGFAFAFFPMTGVVAETHGKPLAGTEFQSWFGALDQVSLPDNSVLNEYVAQTPSKNIPEASLQIAFAPRFSCSPMVSVILSAEIVGAINNDFALQMTADGEDIAFPVLLDELSSTSLQYSYNGNKDEQQKLRSLIDSSSHFSINWVPATQDAQRPPNANRVNTAVFSLLGSRMSTMAVENRCKQHEPAPY
ncbi:hypothetical protein [Granulosicoccus antarcticus]|uniref:Uncharacterized protein n=1 Tax=Granulosicoccus antarcticus IMCC3135 TaxID=1192854 RepID=A0A2Z2P914_9GAMM|nr:hypothetical protein [Granulosicoccus antarcticus]ASJ76384.1 hypothetical protein IMCC3135_31685 [Granulosicoccus antarcticus IMCC3135]